MTFQNDRAVCALFAALSPAAALVLLAFTAALALTAAPSEAHAGGVKDLDDQVKESCRGVQLQDNAANASPLATHCQVAKQNLKKAKSDIVLISTYSAVGAVCLVECIAEAYGTKMNACMPVNTAAIGVEVVTGLAMGQEFSEMITGLVMSAVPMLTGALQSAGTSAASASSNSSSSSSGDAASCITAAMSVLKAAMKGKNFRTEKKAVNNALDEIKALASKNGQQGIDSGGGDNGTSGGIASPGNPGSLTGGSRTTASDSTAAEDPITRACESASNSGDNGSAMSCALAQDSSLSDQLGNPKFHEALKNSSGTDLGGLAARGFENATAGFAASAGNGLTPEALGSFGAIVAKNDTDREPSSTESATRVPTSRGAGGPGSNSQGAGGDSGGSDDMTAQLALLTQQMMGAMNPDAGAEAKLNPGISQVVFAMRTTGPSALSDNPRLSLFDRVTVRYSLEAKRFGGGGISSAGLSGGGALGSSNFSGNSGSSSSGTPTGAATQPSAATPLNRSTASQNLNRGTTR